jgi:hypothetical protein
MDFCNGIALRVQPVFCYGETICSKKCLLSLSRFVYWPQFLESTGERNGYDNSLTGQALGLTGRESGVFLLIKGRRLFG